MKKIFVIAGTSGSGKTTIANALLLVMPNLKKIVTCTTRKNRGNEIDGVDYYFLEKKEFEELIKNDSLLEYEEYGGNFYGSRKTDVEKILNEDKNVLFVVEPKGALTIKNKFENVKTIFLKAPGLEELKKRFESRGDSGEKVKERIELVKRDLSFEKEFEYIVINDKLDDAIKEIREIIEKNK